MRTIDLLSGMLFGLALTWLVLAWLAGPPTAADGRPEEVNGAY